MTFTPRWRIEGTLTTDSPLRIGSGETMPDRIKKDREGREVEVLTCVTDCNDAAYIPGSTLKGNLRSWLKGRLMVAETLDGIFGRGAKGEDLGEGGKAEFWDAYHKNKPNVDKELHPYWNEERLTDVEASTAINRTRRTASENKLYHREIVPPETSFAVEVTGSMDETEVGILLAGFEGFNDVQPLTLGADAVSGKGRMKWEQGAVYWLDVKNANAWMKSGAKSNADAFMSATDIEKLRAAAALLLRPQSGKPFVEIKLQINFNSPFMINDPARSARKQENEADFMPVLDNNGMAVLLSKSFRGAFRSQAERIVRTLDKKACLVDDQVDACEAIDDAEDRHKLCLACQVFGGAGWKSPVSFSRFEAISGMVMDKPQEFVGIDRFTGGGANSMKFNAQPCIAPEYKCILSIDPHRIGPAGLGLVTLALRDLMEGDITLGFGPAKGYGILHGNGGRAKAARARKPDR